MDPTGRFARRFPLVARTRPACVPLARRVAELCDRAREAARTGDITEAAAVHNQAALVASDCGLPDLARQWCHQQVNIYLRARPLGAQVARLALEPITNLARLYIREGQGERAFALMDTLFTAVSSRTDADVDGIEIPADLTDSAETHQHIRSWLWAVLLATGGRALAAAGRWADARARLGEYKGIGRRMLDGRQVAIISHAVDGDTDSALALLADTTPGEPWENAVTACLTIQCHGASGCVDLTPLLDQYHGLDTSTPGLAVFRTRLGLSFVDALGTVDDPLARRIAVEVIDYATATRDGYAARDLLAHSGCRELLTHNQTRELTELVDACALGCGTLPATLLEDLTQALTSAEEIMPRSMTATAMSCNAHAPASS
ncbi:hypothetical protein LX15_003478 [Streptoalloteichus tenebrarius]|uniref:Uncharacterized protein n=1 Tax=Streptoalloteichus tenebrarius (strain ATCC 17920 / DSM 40477 / JCM 4838 / CBS 697.72 / NBRC 16177 / NCIMB 11028 / NRRL B-12390 / A12253. 1 / ISP 5477) TaxID=1933 RepID=A0ABT1HW62_STRSD|nr:hypothetical protein [Streptoalloteichus tenebrarius]MCP2259769.1 hypothetical protein [Streptoalloteichus tenebrarius]